MQIMKKKKKKKCVINIVADKPPSLKLNIWDSYWPLYYLL